MNKRIWYLSLLMMVIGIALVACSSNNNEDTVNAGDSGPVASVEDSTPAVDAQQPADTPALASVEQPDVSEPSPSLEIEVDVDTGVDVGVTLPPAGIFAGASAALEALDSYRFTTSFLFSGQEDGEIESGSIELSGEIMDAQRKHFVWKNLEDNEQFEIIQLEDEAWVYDEEGWEAVPSLVADAMSQAVLVFAPSVVWGGLFGGLEAESTYVGPETIDGIGAHHYTSTYRQWAGIWEGDVLDATGDVWIAEAGYPLRYDFTASGVDENGDSGTISWTMRLTNVGETIVIEPPM